MTIDPLLATHDPSRYTVYQMLEYAAAFKHIKIIQQSLTNIFLCKTQPFVSGLYNQAQIVNQDFSQNDLANIEEFFGKEIFRIKFSANKKISELLMLAGYTFKDSWYIMIADISPASEYLFSLPENVTIKKANTLETINDYKLIFSEAFDRTLDQTNQNFDIFDSILLDPKDNHINTFVLYENELPVSTWAYYAFDNFSIENIGTRNAYRGKGYAYIIMQLLLQEAKKMWYTRACLVASELWCPVYEKVWFHKVAKTNTFIPQVVG